MVLFHLFPRDSRWILWMVLMCVPLGIWELFKSDVLGVIHFRKLPCNLKIHPWKRWFLCWKPPLSGSTLNFGAKFFGLDKWAIRAWRWITNETRNRRSRVVVFSLRETAVDFWSHFKNGKRVRKFQQQRTNSTNSICISLEVSPPFELSFGQKFPSVTSLGRTDHLPTSNSWNMFYSFPGVGFKYFCSFCALKFWRGRWTDFDIFFRWVETTQTFTQGVL